MLALTCEFCHNLDMAHLTGQERAEYVQDMFGRIADRYDRMNRLMTFGQDITWRKYVIDKANVPPNGRLLDIATGTGDIAFEGWARNPTIQTVGTDFSYEMMDAGRRAYPERRVIDWADSDALALPFPENHFDAVTSGFLVRNVINPEKSLSEQLRVLKPAGTVVVLESSPPKDNLLKPFIMMHLNYVIPLIGRIVTGSCRLFSANRCKNESADSIRTSSPSTVTTPSSIKRSHPPSSNTMPSGTGNRDRTP